MIFALNPIHRMSQTILIQQNIFVFTMALPQQHFYSNLFLFYAHYYHIPKKKYIFDFNPTSPLLVTPVSSFILPATNLFELL